MFDRYLTPASPRPWRRVAVIASIGAHLGVGAWLLLAAFWNLERLSPGRTPVAQIGAGGGPELAGDPSGSPPPPLQRRRAATKPRRIKLDETVQPVADPVEVDDGDDGDDGQGTDDGSPDGSPDGVPGGQGKGGGLGIGPPGQACIGECIERRITIETPRKQTCEERGDCPKVVPANLIEGYRIGGNARIAPPEEVRLAMRKADRMQTRATVKLCLDDAGRVDSLRLLGSSGYQAYDAKLLAEMRDWRYRPYEVNGRPIGVCTAVTFIYKMQ
jgi:TonB family protein